MYKISVEGGFSAAHFLRGYKGKCERLHGHNWRIRLTISGTKTAPDGLLFDFSELKNILNEILAAFDHENLNDLPDFSSANPSAENIARNIFEKASAHPALKKSAARVSVVAVWESEKSRAEYEAPPPENQK